MNETKADIFVLPYQENYILSFPQGGQLFLVNAALIRTLQVGCLETDLVPAPPAQVAYQPFTPFSPSAVVLFVTDGCNLNCKYCFATPRYSKPRFLSGRFAATGLNLAAGNAALKGKPLKVHFSGGEPLLDPAYTAHLVRMCREVAVMHIVPLELGLTTNGNIEPETIDFLRREFDTLSFSADGPAGLQGFHRPTRQGLNSFERLDRTLKSLGRETHPRIEIRATFTHANVDAMPMLLEYFYTRWGVRRYCFVPLRPTPRSGKLGLKPPGDQRFFRAFMESDALARRLGVTLYYSAFRTGIGASGHFCAISRDYFGLTPGGQVTACSQFPRQDESTNPLNFYFYGYYDEGTEQIVIDEERRARLHNLALINKEYCQDCFARFSCMGDCPARLFGYPSVAYDDFAELYCHQPSPVCYLNQLLAYHFALLRLGLPTGEMVKFNGRPQNRIHQIEVPTCDQPSQVIRSSVDG